MPLVTFTPLIDIVFQPVVATTCALLPSNVPGHGVVVTVAPLTLQVVELAYIAAWMWLFGEAATDVM